jgi:hypothetical protein
MLGRGAIAIVDSPAMPRIDPVRERTIDSCLRATVARLNSEVTRSNRIVLAMFPTPTVKTFVEFAAAPDCKPHLRHLARALFGRRIKSNSLAAFAPGEDTRRHAGGRIFTRFMLAGFATHRALELLGVDTFEGFPYLACSLWKPPGGRLPSKRERGALAARQKILNRMLPPSAPSTSVRPSTIDLADAAALAMSASAARAGGTILKISHAAEGILLIALPRTFANLTQSQRLSHVRGRLA